MGSLLSPQGSRDMPDFLGQCPVRDRDEGGWVEGLAGTEQVVRVL